MNINKYTVEVIEKLGNLTDKEFDELVISSNIHETLDKCFEELENISGKDFFKTLEQKGLLNKEYDKEKYVDLDFKEESIKFNGGLMGLEYAIYYCKKCDTDFAVKSSSDVVCCPSCKNENIIRGNVQDFY